MKFTVLCRESLPFVMCQQGDAFLPLPLVALAETQQLGQSERLWLGGAGDMSRKGGAAGWADGTRASTCPRLWLALLAGEIVIHLLKVATQGTRDLHCSHDSSAVLGLWRMAPQVLYCTLTVCASGASTGALWLGTPKVSSGGGAQLPQATAA
jgi:hypothetical protein